MNKIRNRTLAYGVALAAAVTLGAGAFVLRNAMAEPVAMVEIPIFEVDPLWPKPIPGEALLGMTIGVSIDEQDNVWITHRSSATLHNNEKGAELNPPIAACCKGAAPV